ncbi:hypothetical protein, partial [Flavobacterium sp.]|uniref:hypothetical protein n=1 Tax=Flavobacterium sp. TaxID=239 RepID=UPI0025B88EFB
SRYHHRNQSTRAVSSTHIIRLDFSLVDTTPKTSLCYHHWIKIQRHNIDRPYGTTTQHLVYITID